MIVVIIIAILASVLLPAVTARTRDAAESALLRDLHVIRRQVLLYKLQHGSLPAHDTTDADAFEDQLTKRTTVDGTVDAAGPLGPYLVGHLPSNPYNNSRIATVKNGPLVSADYDGTGTHGWAYSSTTGEVRGNVADAILSSVETLKPVNSF